MEVKITYFKLTGKYYTDCTYNSKLPDDTPLFEIWNELREKFKQRKAPGLNSGSCDEFIAYIDVPEHPNNHPRLIIPPNTSIMSVIEPVLIRCSYCNNEFVIDSDYVASSTNKWFRTKCEFCGKDVFLNTK